MEGFHHSAVGVGDGARLRARLQHWYWGQSEALILCWSNAFALRGHEVDANPGVSSPRPTLSRSRRSHLIVDHDAGNTKSTPNRIRTGAATLKGKSLI